MSQQALENQFVHVFGHIFAEHGIQALSDNPRLRLIQFKVLDAGETLLRDGDRCDAVPFVIHGSIRIFRSAENGREITLYRVGSGESCILSSACMTSITVFPASAYVEVQSTIAFLPHFAINQLFDENPIFRRWVLSQYANKLSFLFELVEEVAFRKVDERLKEWLIQRCRISKDHVISVTHQDLADHIGSSREVVSRILKDWEQRSLIELSRGGIQLLPGFNS